MRTLWRRFARAHAMSPLQSAPLERWLWGWDLSNSLVWRGLEATMRLFSPAQLDAALWPALWPFGHHPLRALLTDLIEPELLGDPAAPRLFVSATDVETGEAVVFENAAITIDVLLASSCLPFVFPAVEIGGRAYWDGGYSGNPPLWPLLATLRDQRGRDLEGRDQGERPQEATAHGPPRELLLVRAQPAHRPGVPRTPLEITNRLNEIACNNVLQAELDALPDDVALTCYQADDALLDLPISSKFNGEEEFLALLFNAGRTAAAMQGLPQGTPQGTPQGARRSAAMRSRPPAATPGIRIAAP
jgi:NTE family protein